MRTLSRFFALSTLLGASACGVERGAPWTLRFLVPDLNATREIVQTQILWNPPPNSNRSDPIPEAATTTFDAASHKLDVQFYDPPSPEVVCHTCSVQGLIAVYRELATGPARTTFNNVAVEYNAENRQVAVLVSDGNGGTQAVPPGTDVLVDSVHDVDCPKLTCLLQTAPR